jgi:hypothetical protein
VSVCGLPCVSQVEEIQSAVALGYGRREVDARRVMRIVTFAIALVCLASDARGQTSPFGDGSIAGVVRDADGSALPGVVVEASSPTLIEGARSDVTDQAGRYEIRGLRPGLYSVTFTLQSYQTVKRERILIEGAVMRTVDQGLLVGSLADRITVIGDAPLIDVRNTTRQAVYSSDLLDSVASARHAHALAVLVPGVESSARDVGGIGPARPMVAAHGGRPDDQRITVDGFSTGALISQATSNFVPNPEFAQEVVVETTAQGAEPQTGGVTINFVPRHGGNRMSGALYASATNARLQGRNLTPALVDAGATTPPERLETMWDVNPGAGGPIVRDRVWFFAGFRTMRTRMRTSQFYNQHAFQSDNYTFLPDPGRPARSVNGSWTDVQGRVTWSINHANKLAATFSDQRRCLCPSGASPTRAVEAGWNDRNPLQRTYQGEWQSTRSSRLFVEIGVQRREIDLGILPLTAETSGVEAARFASYPQAIGVTVANGQGIVPNNFMFHGPGPADNFSGGGPFTFSTRPTISYRASATYETGRHLFKAGIQHMSGYADQRSNSITLDAYDRPVRYVFSTVDTPQSVTVFSGTVDAPWFVRNDLDHDRGIYFQDRMTTGRVTLTAGVRFDFFKSSFPPQSIPETVFGRAAASFAGGTNLDWKDWTPRLAASFDVAGDGKTAVKVTLNKYVQSQSLAGPAISANPLVGGRGIANNYSRLWFDLDRDFVVDCDVSAPKPNLECTNDISANLLNVTPTPLTDASVRAGWDRRPYNWEFSLGVQHQMWQGGSLDISYFRRSFGNFSAVDDTACVGADRTGCREAGNYRSYDVTVPVDSRLPGGGGYELKGFVDPDCTGLAATCSTATARDIAALMPANQLVLTRDIGARQIENWNGVDVSVNVRARGLFVRAGTGTGRRYSNECEVWARLPEVQGLARPFSMCEIREPFRTSVKGAATYILPRIPAVPGWLATVLEAVEVAGSVQSIPGNELSANYDMTTGEFARSCPSPVADTSCSTLGGFPANLTRPADTRNISVLLPATLYDTRHHQLDLRVGRTFRGSGVRTRVSLLVFNALNASPVLARNNTIGQAAVPGTYATSQQQQADGSYNSLWVPTAILQPRFATLSVAVDF